MVSMFGATGITNAIGSAATPGGFNGAVGAGGDSAGAFSGVMQRAMADVSALQADAAGKVHGLLSGSGVDVHAAMIATDRADMAFELTLAVRNKAVAAYQQLNGMQF